jgi:hypothetical protein
MTSTAPFSCAAALASKDLGVDMILAAGRNIIELPKLAVGTYRYSCSMGMYVGSIVVIPPPTPAS